eukprot:TRINITY_DN9411_c2_g1_i5.p1 TRINITY_DN9411_c2_g1~~TRINITY_DN9411_c2_g1_i5.p1  ORF type:complete len:419 (-),score=83.61 TRINITY_DN9411_c2_g1_i5:106-1362(-)
MSIRTSPRRPQTAHQAASSPQPVRGMPPNSARGGGGYASPAAPPTGPFLGHATGGASHLQGSPLKSPQAGGLGAVNRGVRSVPQGPAMTPPGGGGSTSSYMPMPGAAGGPSMTPRWSPLAKKASAGSLVTVEPGGALQQLQQQQLRVLPQQHVQPMPPHEPEGHLGLQLVSQGLAGSLSCAARTAATLHAQASDGEEGQQILSLDRDVSSDGHLTPDGCGSVQGQETMSSTTHLPESERAEFERRIEVLEAQVHDRDSLIQRLSDQQARLERLEALEQENQRLRAQVHVVEVAAAQLQGDALTPRLQQASPQKTLASEKGEVLAAVAAAVAAATAAASGGGASAQRVQPPAVPVRRLASMPEERCLTGAAAATPKTDWELRLEELEMALGLLTPGSSQVLSPLSQQTGGLGQTPGLLP